VLAVGLLLAVLGPRLFHRGSEPNPSSSVESSAGQQAAGTGQGSSASVASSSPAAATDATKNAAANNSTGGTVHGTVAHQVLPDVQHNAYKTVHGKLKVRIKVTVDSSGKVVVGKFDSRGPSRYFADRALRAAQEWTFNPPQVGGQPVPSEWNLRFEFTRNGASVYSEQTYPR
jgi:TonB family protein